MDKLYESAIAFNKLIKSKYSLHLGSKGKCIQINVSFKEENFHHIIGLQKLSDLDTLNAAKSKKRIFELILNKEITLADIEKSCFFYEIANRIQYSSKLEQLFDSNDFVIRFNKIKSKSSIDADYLITAEIDDVTLHIFLKSQEANEFYIRSFFTCAKDNTTYINGQKKYKVIKKVKISDGKETVLIDNMV